MLIATLAAAYAEAKQYPLAVETARRALQLANAQNRAALAKGVQAPGFGPAPSKQVAQ